MVVLIRRVLHLLRRLLDDLVAHLLAELGEVYPAPGVPRLAEVVARDVPLLVQVLHAHDLVALVVHLPDGDLRRVPNVAAVAPGAVSPVPEVLVVVPPEAVGVVRLVGVVGGDDLIRGRLAIRERRVWVAPPPVAAGDGCGVG